jgi:hypothetical protein
MSIGGGSAPPEDLTSASSHILKKVNFSKNLKLARVPAGCIEFAYVFKSLEDHKVSTSFIVLLDKCLVVFKSTSSVLMFGIVDYVCSLLS